MAKNEHLVRISVDVPRSVNDRLKALAKTRTGSYNAGPMLRDVAMELLEEGSEQKWPLSIHERQDSGESRRAEAHNLLDVIFDSGIEETIHAIETNLETFALATQTYDMTREERGQALALLKGGNGERNSKPKSITKKIS